jgi:nicotinate phosphoribosyltransferase
MHQPEFEGHPSILSGETADIYFLRTRDILQEEGLNPVVTMEVFPSRAGLLCGMREVKALLDKQRGMGII